MDLIADIGATNTRCALLDDRGQIVKSETFQNESFTGVEGLMRVFLAHRRASDQPRRAAICVAAPVHGDEISMLNLDWTFNQTDLKRELGVGRLIVVNDFAALAWSLPGLTPGDYRQIGGGAPVTRTPMVAIGPGSGFGVGCLVPAADAWTAVSGEGGHVTLPASDSMEAAVIDMIRKETGHCSAERVLSGPGLVRLYLTLASMAGRESSGVTPADVTALAAQGEPLARQTLDMFFSFLGNVAGNLALTLGARGGVYVAGGIVQRVVDAAANSSFRERFVAKGRYRDYLDTIPTYVITDKIPAFKGLRSLLGYR